MTLRRATDLDAVLTLATIAPLIVPGLAFGLGRGGCSLRVSASAATTIASSSEGASAVLSVKVGGRYYSRPVVLSGTGGGVVTLLFAPTTVIDSTWRSLVESEHAGEPT